MLSGCITVYILGINLRNAFDALDHKGALTIMVSPRHGGFGFVMKRQRKGLGGASSRIVVSTISHQRALAVVCHSGRCARGARRRSDGFTYLGGFALPIDIFMSEGDQEVNVPPIRALVEILVGGEN